MILRDYQAACVESAFEHFREVLSALVVMATGTGKTKTAGSVVDQWFRRGHQGRVLWLAHREELIEQAADAIREITGLQVAIEMGAHHADEHCFCPAPVIVASVPTLARPKRRRRFKPERFGLIVTDEAHHAPARSYRGIYHYFRHGDEGAGIAGNPEIRHLGLTATPNRSDNLAMGKVFDSVAYEYNIEPAVQDGYLVPVRQAIAVVDDLDLSGVKVLGGDYNAGQLEAILTDPDKKIVLKMCKPVVEQTGDAQTLVFTVGVKQAELMADYLNGRKPGSAAWVSGETAADERKETIRRFRNRQLQYLCNCGVFLEGFDAPAASWVVMARPTKSLPLYVQMLGRATRPLPGTVEGHADAAARKAAIAQSAKPWATVLDFTGNAQIHGNAATVSAADVLGGRYDEETKRYAKKRLEATEGPKAIEEVLDRSEAELALLREESERKARIVAEVDYRVRYLSSPTSGPAREQDMGRRGEYATEKQVWKLVRLGVKRDKAEKMSKRQASTVISKLLEVGGVKG